MRSDQKQRRDSGFTLMELLVGLGLGSVVMAAAVGQFLESSYRFHNQRVIAETQQAAESLLHLMTYEFRMIGNGVPFTQDDFTIGTSGLADAPLPLLLTSDSDSITFRSNLTADRGLLASAYQPSGSQLSFTVHSSDGFSAGTPIYISSMTTFGQSGLQGVIDSISGNQITILPSYTASLNAEFAAGSIVNRVETITYDSPANWNGITRSDSTNTTILTANTRFALRYLDASGVEIFPPLSNTDVSSRLAALEVTVYVRSSSLLKDGSTYNTERTQTVALRNLQYK